MSSVPPSSPSPAPASEYDSSNEIPGILSPTQFSDSEDNEGHARIRDCMYCDLPADTNIRSSDGKVLGAHFSHLQQFTGGLALLCDSPLREAGEYCQVPIDGQTLGLILDILHLKKSPPEIAELGFEAVKHLAEAVETYEVYPAMSFCRFYMSVHTEAHPVEVFAYALKHDRRELALYFFERNMSEYVSPLEMKAALFDRSDLFGYLMLYQHNLIAEARDVLINPPVVNHPSPGRPCTLWDPFYGLVLKRHFGKEFSFTDFDDTLKRYIHLVEECRFCVSGVKEWKEVAVHKTKERKEFWNLLDELNGQDREVKAEHEESETF
ncbi:hypothetical protein V5O48_002714 [Marasmius crinis-equi]|uniref:Uncharacterized protein n=1 Tax=Marasmius crinis-equi TaxID=585013 RepID=A0ABR3FUZ0_9AGAR